MNTLLIFSVLIGIVLCDDGSQKELENFQLGNEQFSGSILSKLAQDKPGNFLFCPFSVRTILSLAATGARKETGEQLTRYLAIPEKVEDVRSLFKRVLPSFRNNEYYNLTTANKIYLAKDFEILEEFKKTALDAFDAEVENINFAENSQAAAKINQWVESKTNNKIKELIRPNLLDEDTKAVLVNALYFSALWEDQFDAKDTRKLPFYKNKKDFEDVQTMTKYGTYKYFEDEKLGGKFLEIPYIGGNLYMTIFLPNEKDGLTKFTESNYREFIAATPKYSVSYVKLFLPRFTFETEINFKDILLKDNLTTPFSDNADFSGISAKEGLKIGSVVQKTFIKVGEQGTEAAAATGIAFVPLSAIDVYPGTDLKEFKADHPFLFYIKGSNTILFVGQAFKPAL